MQKKLLVAAVAGALAVPAIAQAQTSVQIYGAFDMSLHQYRIGSGTAAGTTSLNKWDVYNQSSRLGFKGTEDMGGGLKAWFQIESNVAADGRQQNPQAIGIASRNTAVGLSSGWGSVLIGNWDSPYKVLGGVMDNASVGGLATHRGVLMQNGDTTGSNPNLNCGNLPGSITAGSVPTAICGQTESGTASFHRRMSNTVQYWTPTFGGGFEGRFAFTANEEKSTAGVTGQNNSPSAWAATLGYNSSVWKAFLGYERHVGYRDTAAGIAAGAKEVKDTGWTIGGGYNFGVVDLSIAYEQLKFADSTGVAATANDFKRTNWFIGLAAPIGTQGSAIRAGYSKTPGNKSCGAGIACADTGSRVLTLGYDHALSKRTSVYVAYGAIRNDAAAAFIFSSSPTGTDGVSTAVAAGADVTTLGVGMKHSF